MTDINDRYEANDREPEGDVEHQEPVDLNEVAELLRKTENAFSRAEQEVAERELIEVSVPQMIDEIGDLRLRIAEFEALEKREEWAVTVGGAVPPTGPIQDGEYAEAALDLARKHKGQAWRRFLTVHPWEPIALKAPF